MTFVSLVKVPRQLRAKAWRCMVQPSVRGTPDPTVHRSPTYAAGATLSVQSRGLNDRL